MCIMGRTCSGKTTFAQYIAKRFGFSILKSYTTRSPRPGEEENSDHIFITPEEITKYTDRMVAYTKIGDAEYFSTVDQLMENDIYVIDYEGLKYLDKCLNDFSEEIGILPIMVTASKEIRKERYLKRGNATVEEFEQREANEDIQFKELESVAQSKMLCVSNEGNTIEELNALNWEVFMDWYNRAI